MLSEFFQIGPIPKDQFVGTYNYNLVILSYLVAVFASYIALDFTGRLRDISNTKIGGLMWLIGGAIAMGAGIWSMHFIGMLSFAIPMMSMHYSSFWTILSLLIAMLASGFALFLLKIKASFFHLVSGGIILGLAIASMHYTGMQAMKIEMNVRYLPSLFFLSILVAIIASEAALWLALKSNQVVRQMRVRLKFFSSLIMGAAICGMHYTGMAATIFTPIPEISHSGMHSMDQGMLAISIAGVSVVILSIAFFASTYKDAINEDQLKLARQLGMAEVAASVLHNVGNVLNSVNVSAKLVADKIAHSKMENLENLSILLSEHQHELNKFLTEDPRGVKIPDFLNKINEHWHTQQSFMSNEVSILVKNIQRISDIISIQQGLSKDIAMENLVSIEEILEESLLIIGLNNNKEITIERKYEKLNPILTSIMDKRILTG